MKRYFVFGFIILFIYSAYQIIFQSPKVWSEGVIVAESPIQVDLSALSKKMILYKGATLEPLADYQIKARILSRETYWLGAFAQISPLDLALGWQEMSDSKNLKYMKITQADRFYFYQYQYSISLSTEKMMRTSANVHIIPSQSTLEKRLNNLKVGQIITLKGQLVKAHLKNGSVYVSSLSREDTGPGACEILYVTELID